jgi:hypothetical protein
MLRAAIALLCLMVGVAPATAGERPTLIELFTSEGCSSCPPADVLLARLARRPDVLALSLHVDYWDRLGWKDPFSSAMATRRQERYARLFGLEAVYTPQIVIDGHWQAIGSDQKAVDRALADAEETSVAVPVSVALDRGSARITLGAGGAATPAAVLLVAFDRRHVDRVGGGENDGRVLTHIDVVRGVAAVGRFAGAPSVITTPVPWLADRLAVVLQADDGHIIGVAVAGNSSI